VEVQVILPKTVSVRLKPGVKAEKTAAEISSMIRSGPRELAKKVGAVVIKNLRPGKFLLLAGPTGD
jgi:hypothetical protein